MQCLIFSLDQQLFGFELIYIERVTYSVEITPLPHSPLFYEGMINIHGNIVPVINLRKVLGLATKGLDLSDQFLICRLDGNTFAIWIDQVKGIREYLRESLIAAEEVISDIKEVNYVAKEDGELVLLYDLKKLLGEVCCHGEDLHA